MSNVKPKFIIGKSVCFYFHCKNCFEEATGKCSLAANDDFKRQFANFEEKATPDHCSIILDLLKNPNSDLHKEKKKIYLTKYRCGHYQTGQGQHRICIAGQSGLKIKVVISENKHKDCDYCNNPKFFILKNFQ